MKSLGYNLTWEYCEVGRSLRLWAVALCLTVIEESIYVAVFIILVNMGKMQAIRE